METTNHHRAVQEQGFTVVRDVLGIDQVGRLRFALARYLESPEAAWAVFGGKVKRNPFVMEPDELLSIFSNSVLAAALKEISGGSVKFAREIGLAANMKSSWHNDMRELKTASNDPRDAPGLYNVLFYLQDHFGREADDFALKVRPGSHLRHGATDGAEVAIFVRAGDAIIIDCRLAHRGQEHDPSNRYVRAAVTRLRRVIGAEREYQVVRGVRRLFGRADRHLITAIYGRSDHWTEEYIRNSHAIESERHPGIVTNPPMPSAWQDALRSVAIGF